MYLDTAKQWDDLSVPVAAVTMVIGVHATPGEISDNIDLRDGLHGTTLSVVCTLGMCAVAPVTMKIATRCTRCNGGKESCLVRFER